MKRILNDRIQSWVGWTPGENHGNARGIHPSQTCCGLLEIAGIYTDLHVKRQIVAEPSVLFGKLNTYERLNFLYYWHKGKHFHFTTNDVYVDEPIQNLVAAGAKILCTLKWNSRNTTHDLTTVFVEIPRNYLELNVKPDPSDSGAAQAPESKPAA